VAPPLNGIAKSVQAHLTLAGKPQWEADGLVPAQKERGTVPGVGVRARVHVVRSVVKDQRQPHRRWVRQRGGVRVRLRQQRRHVCRVMVVPPRRRVV
jgi:hypothetical protein